MPDSFDPVIGTRRGVGADSGESQARARETRFDHARSAVKELNDKHADAGWDERERFAKTELDAFLRDRSLELDGEGYYTCETAGVAVEVGEWRRLFPLGSEEPLGALHIRYDPGDHRQHAFVELWLRDRDRG